ncbi:hypothetical protein [Oceanirhabdus sp. W0125-5]|uniref:hypothetical protein n=1 Tax=Oceanirhabdus sp. W0125-5 TaxID=2999116 RepID=UPI0022F3345C|nr:hypothetical protein [Oceanirhabdus sp. W0125-5]WBW98433.1 hypothetical protein OW730_06605 [Oceanirhabdus sp. W0125-5]
MNKYPLDIENFHNTILRIKGISTIECGIDNLETVDSELLKVHQYSHLPHATLLRTNGGLDNEVLVQFEFTLDNSIESLHTLEFISWFVRDNARNGIKIQLRPYALVPVTPYGRQFGKTLKFHIDLFIDGVEETLQPVFEVIRELNKSINQFIDLYNIPIKN